LGKKHLGDLYSVPRYLSNWEIPGVPYLNISGELDKPFAVKKATSAVYSKTRTEPVFQAENLISSNQTE
jgi:hypothetical protein